MDTNFNLLIIIIVLALTFDYINGFHDAANSIATVVMTKVLRPFQAVMWAAFFNFAAYWTFGFSIADTIAKTADTKQLSLVAILAGILAAIAWDLITWYRGIPSSSSHTLIGGFVGGAIAHAGINSVKWYVPGKDGALPSGVLIILAFIFLAPFVGMLSSYLISIWFLHSSKKGIIPKLFTLAIGSASLFFVSTKWIYYDKIAKPKFKGNQLLSMITETENIKWIIVIILILALVGFCLAFSSLTEKMANRVLRKMQLLSSAAFSLGHGGNDAQKVMGLIAAAVLVYSTQAHQSISTLPDWLKVELISKANPEGLIPIWIPLTCHLVIGLGTLSGGWKIIKTMGSKITKVTPLEGFIAETAGALTLYFTEALKVPVSTTHTITGAIIGTGLSRRVSSIKWTMATKILWAWGITIPFSAALAASLYFILKIFIKV
jgi:inorganic phosphate transporter, PiT family